MAKSKKSWQEKLRQGQKAVVEEITPSMSQRWGTGTVVIPAPLEVDEIMRQVPRGKVITITEIRALLAKKHSATIG
jgi:hypothetical protein